MSDAARRRTSEYLDELCLHVLTILELAKHRDLLPEDKEWVKFLKRTAIIGENEVFMTSREARLCIISLCGHIYREILSLYGEDALKKCLPSQPSYWRKRKIDAGNCEE